VLAEGELFKIEGSKITLSREAREMARLNGMSDHQLAEHLMAQAKLREAGHLQQPGLSQ
jgi:hypothetical protein